MRKLVLLLAVLVPFTLACSKSGRGGAGDSDYSGEGNIPVAGADSILSDINFAFDSSEISSAAQQTLSAHSDWLKQNSGTPVVVEGHCDERGTIEYNLALGERRASAVKDYLRSLGVDSSQLSTVSYGEELPLDPGHSEAAWAKNRRAHFSVRN